MNTVKNNKITGKQEQGSMEGNAVTAKNNKIRGQQKYGVMIDDADFGVDPANAKATIKNNKVTGGFLGVRGAPGTNNK
jgi:hypothetical protein